MMNSKGDFNVAQKTIFWMIIGVLISIVVLSFALILSSYKSKLTDVPSELQAELISLRFVNIAQCLAYQDEKSGRVFSGMIDIDKFSDEQMAKCYLTEDMKGLKTYNFKLVLEGEGKEIRTNNFFNEVDFTLFRDVLVRHDSHKVVKDRLVIYVQERIGS